MKVSPGLRGALQVNIITRSQAVARMADFRIPQNTSIRECHDYTQSLRPFLPVTRDLPAQCVKGTTGIRSWKQLSSVVTSLTRENNADWLAAVAARTVFVKSAVWHTQLWTPLLNRAANAARWPTVAR